MIKSNNILVGGSDPRKDGIALGVLTFLNNYLETIPLLSEKTLLIYK